MKYGRRLGETRAYAFALTFGDRFLGIIDLEGPAGEREAEDPRDRFTCYACERAEIFRVRCAGINAIPSVAVTLTRTSLIENRPRRYRRVESADASVRQTSAESGSMILHNAYVMQRLRCASISVRSRWIRIARELGIGKRRLRWMHLETLMRDIFGDAGDRFTGLFTALRAMITRYY